MSSEKFQNFLEKKINLQTLINFRWIAIIGQLLTITVVRYYLEFEFEYLACTILIFGTIILNIYLEFIKTKVIYVNNFYATLNIFYDLSQLALLLYLTGGLTNPFSILIIVPTSLAFFFLSRKSSLFVLILTVIFCTLLIFYYQPLPSLPSQKIVLPNYYLFGLWTAVIVCLIFLGNYIYQISLANRKRSEALQKMESILAKEQTLNSVGSLAAAAAHELGTPLATISLVSSELLKQFKEKNDTRNDLELIHKQIERCKLILKNLSLKASQKDDFFDKVFLEDFIKEILSGFNHLKKNIKLNYKHTEKIKILKKIEYIYSLNNILDNACKFAKSNIEILVLGNHKKTIVEISDDGPGFSLDILDNLGEPYIKSLKDYSSQGMGLGLFISKNFLEKTGADVNFSNQSRLQGATVIITWDTDNIKVN